MARCLPRYRRFPLPSECMCARAQDKAGKAREDSLSEEKRQANQADGLGVCDLSCARRRLLTPSATISAFGNAANLRQDLPRR
jgi:hypothetical protein